MPYTIEITDPERPWAEPWVEMTDMSHEDMTREVQHQLNGGDLGNPLPKGMRAVVTIETTGIDSETHEWTTSYEVRFRAAGDPAFNRTGEWSDFNMIVKWDR